MRNAWTYRLLLVGAFAAGGGFTWWWLRRQRRSWITLRGRSPARRAAVEEASRGRRNGRPIRVTIASE